MQSSAMPLMHWKSAKLNRKINVSKIAGICTKNKSDNNSYVVLNEELQALLNQICIQLYYRHNVHYF